MLHHINNSCLSNILQFIDENSIKQINDYILRSWQDFTYFEEYYGSENYEKAKANVACFCSFKIGDVLMLQNLATKLTQDIRGKKGKEFYQKPTYNSCNSLKRKRHEASHEVDDPDISNPVTKKQKLAPDASEVKLLDLFSKFLSKNMKKEITDGEISYSASTEVFFYHLSCVKVSSVLAIELAIA